MRQIGITIDPKTGKTTPIYEPLLMTISGVLARAAVLLMLAFSLWVWLVR